MESISYEIQGCTVFVSITDQLSMQPTHAHVAYKRIDTYIARYCRNKQKVAQC